MIGTNIDALLRIRRMTQAELAERLNVTQATVSRWTTGERPLPGERIDEVCRVLGVSRGVLEDADIVAVVERTLGDL
ncbi:MAG: hypothetical protein GHCLOJNM_01545 [bacterium]|nr:hypothetical protein [bacterium]